MTGDEDPLGVALVGFGLAGEAFHAPLIAAEPGLKLSTVVTSSGDRARRVRERYPGVAVVCSADELWAAPRRHDMLVVASPNVTHLPLGLAGLEAGMHVVIDKPLTARVEDARRLEQVAAERERTLAVFHNRRLDGDFLTVRRLLEAGDLGQVLRYESSFERWRPEPRADGWRERGTREEAGGLLFDLGSHLIDQALVLFGPVEAVYAELDRRREGVAVDDDDFVALRHRSGVRSHLSMSHVAAQQGPRMRVLGSQAGYVKWGLDRQEAALRAGGRPGGPGWGEEPPESWGTLGADRELQRVRTEPGDYPRFYRELVAAIGAATPPPVTAAEAIAGLEVIEAAFESARAGTTITLGRSQR